MKNLYLIIAMLCIGRVFSQDYENANWIFDEVWLDFKTAYPDALAQTSIPATAYETLEGCASVSDSAGDLLFFTNGYDTYWLDSGVVTPFGNNANSPNDALLGHFSSAQNVIIIPKPQSPGRYYIVTLVGGTSNSVPTGFYYSEVDEPSHEYVTGMQNIVLEDHLGVDIDNAYDNISEALTSVLAQDGVNYWLIAHIQNKFNSVILTYKVTSTGITVSQDFAMPLDTVISYSLKVSPDRSRISLCQHSFNPFLGTFDNTTGEVVMDMTPVGGNPSIDYCYSADFSPNSQNLYYTRRLEGTFGVEVNNPTVEHMIDSRVDVYGVQRAMNDRVYVAWKGQSEIIELTTPNDINNPGVTTVSLDKRISPGAIPQWIWSECIATLEDYNEIASSDIRHEERELWIRNYNYVNTGGRGIYHARRFVEMLPGFKAEYGSQFAAYIEGCNNSFYYRPANPKGFGAVVSDEIRVYPNPASSLLNIVAENSDIESLSITTIDGKLVHKQDARGTEQQIDVSRFANGVYVVTVRTFDGKTLNAKFIKN